MRDGLNFGDRKCSPLAHHHRRQRPACQERLYSNHEGVGCIVYTVAKVGATKNDCQSECAGVQASVVGEQNIGYFAYYYYLWCQHKNGLLWLGASSACRLTPFLMPLLAYVSSSLGEIRQRLCVVPKLLTVLQCAPSSLLFNLFLLFLPTREEPSCRLFYN